MPLAVTDVSPRSTVSMNRPRTTMLSMVWVPMILVRILSPGRRLGVLADSQQSAPPPWFISIVPPGWTRFTAEPTRTPSLNALILTWARRG